MTFGCNQLPYFLAASGRAWRAGRGQRPGGRRVPVQAAHAVHQRPQACPPWLTSSGHAQPVLSQGCRLAYHLSGEGHRCRKGMSSADTACTAAGNRVCNRNAVFTVTALQGYLMLKQA